MLQYEKIILITGTPIQNFAGELIYLLSFIIKDFYIRFKQRYQNDHSDYYHKMPPRDKFNCIKEFIRLSRRYILRRRINLTTVTLPSLIKEISYCDSSE